MALYSPSTINTDVTWSSSQEYNVKNEDIREVYNLDIQNEDFQDKNDSQLTKIRKARIFMFTNKSDIAIITVETIFTIIGGLCPAISSILIGEVFECLSNWVSGKYTTNQDYMNHVTSTTMSLIILGAASIVIIWITISFWMQVGERQGLRARENMFKTLLERPVSWYDESEQIMGDLTQMNRCVEELRSGTAETSALLLQSIVSIISLACVSLYSSWSTTLVMLATVPIIVLLTYLFTFLIERFTKEENLETANAAKILDWSLTSAKLVRVFSTQQQEYIKFSEAVKKCRMAFLKLTISANANNGIVRFLMLCMFVQAFWFGSIEVKQSKLSAGNVITCFASGLILGDTFRGLLPHILMIQKSRVAIKRIQGFIELKKSNTVKTKFKTKIEKGYSNNILLHPEICNGDIKFKNVEFAYPSRPDAKVLKHVTLHFPAGQTTFLVGRSGSGKSTLGNLLLNFYQPNSGRIEIDGFSVNSLSSVWLTNNITLVEQNTTLFKDSLKNNILMGRSSKGFNSVTEEELQNACQMALLKEVIRDLKDGLDTLVGTNGVQLSGGQQQRVAIARARLRDTPILILDESVSALDIVLRDLIITAIKKWRTGKTTIILTHEYNQIGMDDYVYLMENGMVAEKGYKKDLEKSGIFKHLASLQESTIGKIHEKNFTIENINDATFLSKVNKRLSTQVLSSVNPMSYFANYNDEFDFEIGENLNAPPQKRNKRTLNFLATSEKIKQNEEKQLGSEGTDERPELTPIMKIIINMVKTVENKPFLVMGIIFAVLNGAVTPVFSYTFTKLLNGIVPEPGTDVGSNSYLIKWSIIVILLAFFDGFTSFMKSTILQYSSEKWIYYLRKEAFKKISEQGMRWFESKINTPAEINALILNDARDLRALVSTFISILISILVLGLAGIVWAMIESWKLSLVCLSLIPLFVLTSMLYAGLLQTSEINYKNAVADLETQVYETVIGIKTIRALRLNDYFKNRFEERVVVLKKVAFKRALFTGLGVSITNFLTFAVQGILLYYGLELIGDDDYSPTEILEAFVLLVFSIMTCVQLMTQIPEISRGQRSGSYIFNILKIDSDDVESGGTIIPHADSENIISFDSLDFAYPTAPHKRVLKNFSLLINRGEHIAIIGESGSGKSTLTLLLTRLFKTERDSLYIEGADINSVNIEWLRNRVTLVDQKAVFFDGTIYDNITYGLENISESEVYNSLKLANIYDFVISLPQGLHSRIDTSLVSGGQAQRLSIARALVRKPNILILDECTSALDAESTSKIIDTIHHNLRGKNITIIMITHSEDLMKIADRVVSLKNGRVVEDGNYNNLFKAQGEMFRIVSAGRLF
ncbi:hypothetical protein WICMUC_001469 [Wickerhamomyces mucosus]|uniref:Alpha-factor-transporting ATPase n=1 Tax=Wickerhamomyces mucosus TaxID=1378264 RepID=A0A9P8PU57_9ASCO|nr:hypothetical protein WICMUC_001469 [Wickerhamomyces mucosus]